MKFSLKLLPLLALMGALVCPANAASRTPSYASTIGNKAGIGIINIASGWLEIPKTMINSTREDGPAVGLSGGFFKGLANMLGRTVMGVVDLTTFPIPTKPMIEPPTIWQQFDQETTFGNSWEMYETR